MNLLKSGGGDQLRDFTYVDDCINAFLLASDQNSVGKIYNVGGDCVISLKEVAQMMVDVFGKGELIIKEFPSERKKIDIGDYYSDYSLIKRELGWEPHVSLRNGITKTFEYYKRELENYL